MTTNLERFRKDLKQLIDLGITLELPIILDMVGKENFRKEFCAGYQDSAVEKFVDNLPQFQIKYEEWYSEAISLIRQLLPDRLAVFPGILRETKE
jgi:hypothetical protein